MQPMDQLEFLGVWYDFRHMTISVTEERMAELRAELGHWQDRSQHRRKHLESLLGKLQFVSNCV